MSKESNVQKKKREESRKRAVLLVISIGIAVVCFTLVAVLPKPDGPLFRDPLRGFLTGLGLLGLAYPPCLAGSALHKRAMRSPYFEEGFMATALYIVGYLCLILALICIGLSIYALVKQL
jgi:hypothetical protein